MLDRPDRYAPDELADIVRLERLAFAAKIRMARAAMGWSQSELASRAGLTQRSVHKLEQGETEARRATVRAIEFIWRQQGIEFEDLADGGFRVSIRASLLEAPLKGSSSGLQPAEGHEGMASAHKRVYRV